MGMVNCHVCADACRCVKKEKDEKGYFFSKCAAHSAIISLRFVEKGMLLQVSLKRCNMGRRGGLKVKPDHCRYLAMIELHKTDNLIKLLLYELIRVLLREYMTVFTIFPILYCPKTQHLAFRGNFPLHMDLAYCV